MAFRKIKSTGHTFNPLTVCTKVNALCEHRYAETLMDQRTKRAKWGPTGARVRTATQNRQKPIRWICYSELVKTRRRVFFGSLADVYYDDRDVLASWQMDLFQLVDQTPSLDCLSLTKHPANCGLIREAIQADASATPAKRANVRLGTPGGTQETTNKLISELTPRRHLAPIVFLSLESPLEQSTYDWNMSIGSLSVGNLAAELASWLKNG